MVFGDHERGDFNPLPRKEGDEKVLLSQAEDLMISIHSLVKRETVFRQGFPTCLVSISIHSLVKRETSFCDTLSLVAFISIHSLVKRETAVADGIAVSMQDFNPLPRKEGDNKHLHNPFSDCTISIHSLVKRETLQTKVDDLTGGISIHSLVKRETWSVSLSLSGE